MLSNPLLSNLNWENLKKWYLISFRSSRSVRFAYHETPRIDKCVYEILPPVLNFKEITHYEIEM